MEQFNYRVQFEPFTERHYVKKFQKAYKDKWFATGYSARKKQLDRRRQNRQTASNEQSSRLKWVLPQKAVFGIDRE